MDVKRGPEHNMVGSSPVYASLLEAAVQGLLLAVVGGPNCRTRSVLRHYAPGPRPLRTWEHPYGIPSMTAQEREQVEDDDVMMWRMIFLHTVAAFGRRSVVPGGKVPFLLEHPLEPDYIDCWGWEEVAFNQGDF